MHAAVALEPDAKAESNKRLSVNEPVNDRSKVSRVGPWVAYNGHRLEQLPPTFFILQSSSV